jgi:hypothetical protein
MVTPLLVVLLIIWTATMAPAAAEPRPGTDSPPPPGATPDQPGAPVARDDAGGRASTDDEELIRNLDLLEHFDLLNTVEVLGAVNTPDTPEEEF